MILSSIEGYSSNSGMYRQTAVKQVFMLHSALPKRNFQLVILFIFNEIVMSCGSVRVEQWRRYLWMQ
jgi:hypothetical protein